MASRLKILVVGLLRYDSGKTSIARSLVLEAKDRGFNVGVVKPVSGFDAWSQYKYVLKSMEYGKLIGEDLYILHSVADSRNPIEIEGPIVMLLAPPDPSSYSWRISLYIAATTSTLDQVVVARITTCRDDVVETHHYMVEENIERTSRILRERLVELIEKLRPRPEPIEKNMLEKRLFLEEILEGVDKCVERVIDSHEITIIESYNDAAAPTQFSAKADVVIAVAPGKIALYPGEKYWKAISLVGEIKNPLATTTSDVLGLVKPFKTIDTEPLIDPKNTDRPWTKGLLDKILDMARDI